MRRSISAIRRQVRNAIRERLGAFVDDADLDDVLDGEALDRIVALARGTCSDALAARYDDPAPDGIVAPPVP